MFFKLRCLFVSVKQKFGDKELDNESDSSSSESEDDDARVSYLCCLFVCFYARVTSVLCRGVNKPFKYLSQDGAEQKISPLVKVICVLYFLTE